MDFRKSHIDKFVSLLLLVGFILLGYNQSVNFHKHITPDGKIITHWHPYSDSKNNGKTEHKHSKIQFVNFDNLSHQFTAAGIIFNIDNNQFKIYSSDSVLPNENYSTNDYLLLNHFRAPPLS